MKIKKVFYAILLAAPMMLTGCKSEDLRDLKSNTPPYDSEEGSGNADLTSDW